MGSYDAAADEAARSSEMEKVRGKEEKEREKPRASSSETGNQNRRPRFDTDSYDAAADEAARSSEMEKVRGKEEKEREKPRARSSDKETKIEDRDSILIPTMRRQTRPRAAEMEK